MTECKGWLQEAALRCLRNNLHPDVAERPEDLVVYGGNGKAARALDLRAPLQPSAATAAAVAALRSAVTGPGPDRYLSVEIEAAVELVRSGAVLDAVEAVTGPLE